MSGGNNVLPEGVTARMVETPRLATHLLEKGPENGVPVLFIHGNVSSSLFFDETLAALPDRYRGLAPDLRGFGSSETKPLDAIPGWPGDDVYPRQPMVAQIRAVLDEYAAGGGTYREEAIPDCGHTPHVERPEQLRRLLFDFLDAQGIHPPDVRRP
jgi:pimeloyl-ACP methyl ester carboxylesterase